MIQSFVATLNPMLMLVIYIIIGFVLGKTKILAGDSATTVAKLETWIFCPALSFVTMAKYFTVSTLSEHTVNIIFAGIFLGIAIPIAIVLARLIIKKPGDERNIYKYVLTFGNYGFMGEPLIKEIYGNQMLANFKLFCIPVTLIVYMWGVGLLIPKGKGKSNALKSFFNPATIALFLGMAFGITGIGSKLPSFVDSTLASLSNCMAPVAMILLGITVSSYNTRQMLKGKRIYLATALRLLILPVIIIPILFGIKELACVAFNLTIGNQILMYAFFIAATPHGMNTIVFPKAYGGDPKIGASLAMTSHALAAITIPLLFSLLQFVFPF